MEETTPNPQPGDQPVDPERAAAEQASKARMDQYKVDQQGLKDWTKDEIAAHARAIALAIEFEEAQGGEITPPSDKELRAELELAGTKFEKSPEAMWRVLRIRYRESDAALNARAEEFVSEYADDLRQAHDRRQLGDMDDDEEPDNEVGGAPTAADAKTSFAATAKEAAAAAARECNRGEEEVLKAIQKAIRNHPEIGDVSGPPGKGDGMKTYGRWRSTKYGVFAPGAGIWPWDLICKPPLDAPFGHSSLHPGDTDPRVHLTRTAFDREHQIEREIEIPRWKIATGTPVAAIRALMHYNVYVPRTAAARAEIIDFLNWKSKKLKKIIRTKTTGWFKIDGDYCFVLPLVPPDLAPIMPKRNPPLAPRRKSKANAKPKIEVRLDVPIGEVGRRYGLNVSGTVEEWQQIARRLDGCSNVALAAATAFTGPLLLFAGEQLGGFHIYGPSTIGKSLAGALGESIWGRPSTTLGEGEPFGAKWATASDVGIVALAAMRTDLSLFLDELGSAKSAKEKLGQAIYIVTGGTQPLRGNSKGILREQASIRANIFSTGEYPLRDFLIKMDDTEGRAKRLTDVPALVRGKGREGSALEPVPHEELGDFCRPIYTALGRVHGRVGQAWLRYLGGEAEIKARLDQHCQVWLALPEIAELLHRDPQKDSVIRRFALYAAVLRMAIEAGLWPWSIENSDRGIVACCLRWAADAGMPVVTLEMKAEEQEFRDRVAGERAADHFLVLNKRPGKGNGVFVPVPEHPIRFEDPMAFKEAGTLSGFIKIDGLDTRILVYHDEFLRLTEGLDHDALVAHLERNGWLTIKKEKVKGRPDTYYVLTEAFLRGEDKPPRTAEP